MLPNFLAKIHPWYACQAWYLQHCNQERISKQQETNHAAIYLVSILNSCTSTERLKVTFLAFACVLLRVDLAGPGDARISARWGPLWLKYSPLRRSRRARLDRKRSICSWWKLAMFCVMDMIFEITNMPQSQSFDCWRVCTNNVINSVQESKMYDETYLWILHICPRIRIKVPNFFSLSSTWEPIPNTLQQPSIKCRQYWCHNVNSICCERSPLQTREIELSLW